MKNKTTTTKNREQKNTTVQSPRDRAKTKHKIQRKKHTYDRYMCVCVQRSRYRAKQSYLPILIDLFN